MSGCDVGSRSKPFNLNPDPRYFYCGPTHRKVLTSVLRGIDDPHVPLVLIGQSGSGKTALIHKVLLKLPPETYTIFLRYTTLSVHDLIHTLAGELDISAEARQGSDLLATICKALGGTRVGESAPVVIVDEAQNLCSLGLGTLCDLNRDGLISLVLVGQPHLRERVDALQSDAHSASTALVLELDNLPASEARDLVRHRLQVAGEDPEAVFSSQAFELIYRQTLGNPRRINVLCKRALEFVDPGSSADECMEALREAACGLAEELPRASVEGTAQDSAAPPEALTDPARQGRHTADIATERQPPRAVNLLSLLSRLASTRPSAYTVAALGAMLMLVAMTSWLVDTQFADAVPTPAESSDDMPSLRSQMASLNQVLAEANLDRDALLEEIAILRLENRELRERAQQSAAATVASGNWRAPTIEDFAALETALLSTQNVGPLVYRVQAGDTLLGVAHRHQLSLSQIARWNGLPTNARLRVGERLVLTPREELNYTVRWGDTLSGLKRRFNVTFSELRRWNRLPRDGRLQTGQRLRVYVSLPFES